MIFPNPFRFVAAMSRAAWCWLRGYRVLTTEQEEAFRWMQCRVCPSRVDGDDTEPGVTGQCELCSCFLSGKLALTMEKCPDRRWGRIWRKKPSLTSLVKNRTTN
jgi:hypothetical protein